LPVVDRTEPGENGADWGDWRWAVLDLAVIVLGLACAIALLQGFVGGNA
jgi:hypothetical protein